MVEGRELWLRWTIILRESPGKVNWSSHFAKEWLALVRNGSRVGILVAHHQYCFTIDGLFEVKLVISGFKVVNSRINLLQVLRVVVQQVTDFVIKL